MIDNIEKITLNEWLSELKKYQRDAISTLIDTYGEEEAIAKWLSANGPENNVSFGGIREADTKPFLDRIKEEFKKFICNHPDYQKDWQKLNTESTVFKNLCITTISAALGATFGYSATLLAPAVVILLAITGKIGVRAYCNS